MPRLFFWPAIAMRSGRELNSRGICGRENLLILQKDIKIPNLRKNPGLGFIYVSSFFCSSLDSKAAKVPELSLIFVTENLLNF